MRAITFAPAYVAFYPMLANIAREHGYSLAIHGSVGNQKYSDLDLVAVPWIDEAADVDVLINAIWDYASKFMDMQFKELFKAEFYCENKPHGRRAWFMQMGNGAGIDISVMPKTVG